MLGLPLKLERVARNQFEARLAESGVQRGPIEDMGGAQMLQFFDPDGNEIVAIQPDA